MVEEEPQTPNVNYGWICPGCGRCYSPSQKVCMFCGPSVSVETSTYWTDPAMWLPRSDVTTIVDESVKKYYGDTKLVCEEEE